METLVENAKYVETDQSSSKCALECKPQQSELVSCMASIQNAREQATDGDLSEKEMKEMNSCLAPAVAAWTACCSKANEE